MHYIDTEDTEDSVFVFNTHSDCWDIVYFMIKVTASWPVLIFALPSFRSAFPLVLVHSLGFGICLSIIFWHSSYVLSLMVNNILTIIN